MWFYIGKRFISTAWILLLTLLMGCIVFVTTCIEIMNTEDATPTVVESYDDYSGYDEE